MAELFGLPESTTIDGTLYCHASPGSDMETFFPEPGERDAELLLGVEARRVVCGHIHISFDRDGPGGIEIVNPGSVGMPWDGDHRAAYAVIEAIAWSAGGSSTTGRRRWPRCESGWGSCPRAAWSLRGSKWTDC